MKRILLLISFFVRIGVVAQEANVPEVLGTKPIISINGVSCNILNQTFSCVPRVCDPVSIVAGDSVEFCTVSQISLNSDTNYWMRWEFSGSSTYPLPVWDSFPTDTPLCYNVTWLVPGNYTIHIFYNGWLSAYPWSDCWAQGPSHWIVNLQVIATGISETLEGQDAVFLPNPSTGNIAFVPNWTAWKNCNLVIRDITSGRQIRNIPFDSSASLVNIFIGDLPNGAYLCSIESHGVPLYRERLILLK